MRGQMAQCASLIAPYGLRPEDNDENPIWHGSIDAGGGGTRRRCDPGSACAGQTAQFQAALKIGEKYAKFNILAVNGVRQ
jgi:hypothetical protein